MPSSRATHPLPGCDPYVDNSCNRTNLKPWQSGAQGVVGARTTVYYAMGLQKAGTSLMGAALAARLGGGYQNEAVYRCCKQKSAWQLQRCAGCRNLACDLSGLSSAAFPTAPHFFMKSIASYFYQCGNLMVSLLTRTTARAHAGLLWTVGCEQRVLGRPYPVARCI
eukprot:scaffold83919_cov75-Phaeocystis_antarctica.AAC.2